MMNQYSSIDTICALSTPMGVGGIAVVRVSGPKAWTFVNDCFSKEINEGVVRKALFGEVLDGDQILDEVVVTAYQGPRSFTGEDVVEIACHGSRFIQQRLLEVLLRLGCRMAMPGEYTQRAYLNGKLDLSRAEAVGDVIAAESAAAHRQAVHQMRGGFSKEIDSLRDQLVQFSSLLELELDFSEEDVEFANREQLRLLLVEIQRVVVRLKDSFRLGNAIKNGIPVALVGPPNAGKSTLLNALLNEERAIVSDIAGTTRDTVEELVNLGGYTFRFIDTAGIRDTEDVIERMGIDRSIDKVRHAQLVVILLDAKAKGHADSMLFIDRVQSLKREDSKLLVCWNKADLSEGENEIENGKESIRIVAKDGFAIDGLKRWLLESIAEDIDESETVVTNARHFNSLCKSSQSLDELMIGLQSGIPADLLAVDVRGVLFHLGEITGKISADDVLNSIFGKFCIGK
ncbi:MAG: tRNA uridine-5-carboxymethylaminomethyl(34) synthesis GTPase MnmE [Bacteroidota bacterium]